MLYVATFADAVYVLHCFAKRTQQTALKDVRLAKKPFDSVWDAIEDTPGEAEAMKARAQLLRAVQKKITASGLSQAAAARLLKVTQPRVSDLMRGKIDLFSAEMLIDMLRSLGTQVKLTFKAAA